MGKGHILVSRELAKILLYLPDGAEIVGCEWYVNESIGDGTEGRKCLKILVEDEALPDEEPDEPYHYTIPLGIGYHTWRPTLGKWKLSEEPEESSN